MSDEVGKFLNDVFNSIREGPPPPENVIRLKKENAANGVPESKNQLYLRLDYFVGEYYIVLDMREGTDRSVYTNISIAKERASTDDTYYAMVIDRFDIENCRYSFLNCTSLEIFHDLIYSINRDGEAGLIEVLKERFGHATKGLKNERR